jgi:hypothetical protein
LEKRTKLNIIVTIFVIHFSDNHSWSPYEPSKNIQVPFSKRPFKTAKQLVSILPSWHPSIFCIDIDNLISTQFLLLLKNELPFPAVMKENSITGQHWSELWTRRYLQNLKFWTSVWLKEKDCCHWVWGVKFEMVCAKL